MIVGFLKKIKRTASDLKYWKVGWIAEIDEKLNSSSLVLKEKN